MECEKDVELYRKSIEGQRVHIFLAGLNCEFDQIRGDILRKYPIPELEECYSLVRHESVRLTTMKGEPEKPEASALKNSHKNSTSAVVESKAEQYIEEKGSALVATAGNGGKVLNICAPVSNSTWIIDSGASDHMTFDSRQASLKPSSQKFVSTANGTSALVIGEGSLSLTDTLNLDYVLVVPSLDYNFLSDIQTRQTIGCGVKRGNLYYLDIESKSLNQLCQALTMDNDEATKRKSDICHRASFPLSLNKSLIPFMVIHSDVWGPSKVATLGGARCTIDFKTPYQVLTEAPTTTNLPPHVFGCVAFKGYRCYHPPTQRMFITLDVVFQEDTMYFSLQPKLQGEYQEEVLTLDLQIPKEVELSTREEVAKLNARDMDELNLGNGEHLEREVSSPSSASESLEPQETNTPNNYLSAEDAPDMAEPSRKKLPPRHTRALADPRWKAAINEEMESLKKNETWELVDCPPGKKTVGCRWVYTVKYKADGTVERFKARLVAKGYTQFDVKNAFLHGELSEEVYMDLPPRCMIPENYTQKVCILKKSLYGLKQSPRAWFGRFTKSMKAFGYNQSNTDHTLFLKKQHGKITALIVYVDDMVVTGNDPEERKALQSYLFKEFEMKDLGPLKFFLGIEVSRSIKGLKLSVESNQVPVDKGRYQRLVGRLMYLAHTRPDLIAYALSVVSQFMHNPREQHMNAVVRILRYLKSSSGKGILFTKNADCQNVDTYTDVDWTGAIDDRHSTSGYFTFV
ncbi:uncharacterized protein [Arachis hypogaea]|uniref:uncharacterized protein n=1 Tax=Arachis hypogaea TaxID=3818 RepID=UPI003B2232E8